MLGVELLESITDDLDVNMDPENYQDQASPAPPAPGNYRFVVKKVEEKKDRDSKVIRIDGKYPIITLQQLEIVEPVEFGRLVSPFHDIKTKPFERFGSLVSEVGDITRAYDQTRGWSGLQEGLALLNEYFDTNATFVANLGWEAFDKAFLDQALAEAGLENTTYANRTDDQKQVVNALYKKARLRTRSFPVRDGRRIHVAQGPSGDMLEARPVITRFIPSEEGVKTKLGPSGAR